MVRIKPSSTAAVCCCELCCNAHYSDLNQIYCMV